MKMHVRKRHTQLQADPNEVFQFNIYGALPWSQRIALLFGAHIDVQFYGSGRVTGMGMPSEFDNKPNHAYIQPSKIGRWINERRGMKSIEKTDVRSMKQY